MEPVAEASPRPGARITSVVYLLYFLTAVSVEVFVGNGRLGAYDTVNLIAYAFYIAVTLLFYYMFKPANRSLLCSRHSSVSRDASMKFLACLISLPTKSAPWYFSGPIAS
jgi:hypothetical protein